MDFSGLIGKFPVNRTLDEQEYIYRLKHDKHLNLTPRHQLCVIKMNSTYMEVVDKWYGWRGAVTTITSLVLIVVGAVFGWPGLEFILKGAGLRESTLDSEVAMLNGLAMLSIALVFVSGVFWIMRKELFAYTHYPIRFNRKNRTVYVVRTDGNIISHPWDDLFFTLVNIPVSSLWEIRAHMLDKNGQTVKETFALSYSGTLGAPEAGVAQTPGSDDFVRAHWEFIRRYMEEGPEEISKEVQFCMPIDRKRESVRLGFERIFANFAGAPILLYLMVFPFCILVSMFRIAAMRTSKIPQWPCEVDASCIVEQDDPYAIMGSEYGERVAVYPVAARAAGVQYIPLEGRAQ